MSTEPIGYERSSLPVPPSYEACTAVSIAVRAEYEVRPLALAALFSWDEEYDD